MTLTQLDGFYEAGTNPCAPHPTKKEHMDHIVSHAIARLKSLGATEDQAVKFVQDNGTEVVRSESDGMLKVRIADLTEDIPGYDPLAFHVEEVIAYATEHPDELAAILEAEQAASKPRKTLVAALEELSTSADGAGGESEPDAGVEGKTHGDDADAA